MGASKTSAGLLLYRGVGTSREVLLAHFGGPFFKGKDAGAWAVPKGEVEAGEDLFQTAQREFAEELGAPSLSGPFHSLGSVTQKSGKVVHAWAVRGDFEPSALKSNTFELEWPRGSGRVEHFPEVDRVEWFSLSVARQKIIEVQIAFLERLEAMNE